MFYVSVGEIDFKGASSRIKGAIDMGMQEQLKTSSTVEWKTNRDV